MQSTSSIPYLVALGLLWVLFCFFWIIHVMGKLKKIQQQGGLKPGEHVGFGTYGAITASVVAVSVAMHERSKVTLERQQSSQREFEANNAQRAAWHAEQQRLNERTSRGW